MEYNIVNKLQSWIYNERKNRILCNIIIRLTKQLRTDIKLVTKYAKEIKDENEVLICQNAATICESINL